ncbi:DUF1772-domain-containing protein [Stipitochalara longipes BDJ]|nr:DUF1772-domain-containing protein [Stipitochalara longipes BDJ]
MSSISTTFRTAQAVGLGGAMWLSGNIEALSLISVPALSKSQKQDSVPAGILARQWKYIYDDGKIQNPSIAVIAGTSFAYLAWSVRSGTALSLVVPKNSAQIYSVAALLTYGMIPYTAIFMLSTNQKLMAKADQAVGAKGAVATDDKEVIELLKNWAVVSGIRGLLPLLGGIVSMAAILA